jgi:hypothetical protein
MLARFCLTVFALVAFAGHAAPKLVIEAGVQCPVGSDCRPANWSDDCDPSDGDLMRVSVDSVSQYYCSAYGEHLEQLATDGKGHRYLLLQYAAGRGIGPATTLHLVVLRVTNGLEPRGQFQMTNWVSERTLARYRYRVDRPARGGIVLYFTRYIDGPKVEWAVPPRHAILRVD